MFFASRLVLTSIALYLAAVPALAQDVGCFKTGVQGNCTSAISTFCSSVQNITVGQFDNAARCVNTAGPVCNFFAWNDRPAAAGNKINVANCISALTLVSQVCPLGGSGLFEGANFVFTVVPTNASTAGCGSNAALVQ